MFIVHILRTRKAFSVAACTDFRVEKKALIYETGSSSPKSVLDNLFRAGQSNILLARRPDKVTRQRSDPEGVPGDGGEPSTEL
jgi:hypothetical protein